MSTVFHYNVSMPWQSALLGNIFFASIRDPFYKKIVDRLDPYLVMFHTNIWGMVLFSAYYIVRNRLLPPIYFEMMLLGVVFTVSYGFYLTAIRFSLSQSVIFRSYSLAITLLLTAVFLGEWMFFDPLRVSGIKNITGVLLAGISLYTLTATGAKKEQKLERTWLLLILGNIILNGFGSFWSKSFLASHAPAETLLSQYVGGMVVLPFIMKAKKMSIRISKGYVLQIFILSVLEFFTLILFYEAYRKGPAVLVLPIQALVITIMTTMAGLIIFKETHLYRKEKAWGLGLGLFGALLLTVF